MRLRDVVAPVVCLFVAVMVGTLAGPFDGLGVALAVAACVPLLWRERWPLWTFGAVTVLSFPFHQLDYAHDALLAPILVALYTVAVHETRRRALIALAAVAGLVLAAGIGGRDPDVLDGVGWMSAAVACGLAVRASRSNARSRERLRIARDVHDLLAHSITVSQVQAGVAAHLVGEDAIDKARLLRVLDTIVEASAQARAELRATLDGLRDGSEEPDDSFSPPKRPDPARPLISGESGANPRFPLPTDGLLGLTVHTRGASEAAPPAAHPVIREALTNAARHGAGEATVAHVRRPNGVTITVANPVVPGHGLTGMAERARGHGGTLTATFTVTLDLPLEST